MEHDENLIPEESNGTREKAFIELFRRTRCLKYSVIWHPITEIRNHPFSHRNISVRNQRRMRANCCEQSSASLRVARAASFRQGRNTLRQQQHEQGIIPWKFMKTKNRQPFQVVCFGSGRRTRTSDLRVMSPTSCQLLYPAMYRSMRCRGTRSIAFVNAKIRQIFESAK